LSQEDCGNRHCRLAVLSPIPDEALGDRNWYFAYFLGSEDNGIGSEESGNPLTIGPFSAR
jgi:hypothetical protein